MSEIEKHRLIQYLESLATPDSRDRGALASLRRALYDPVAAYPFILPYLPKEISYTDLNLYALLAALFALHPQTTTLGNMGAHLRVAAGDELEATERRFVNLLRAHIEDLPVLLRHCVSILQAKDVAVNWEQLRRDLLAWNHPDQYVQKNWARSFWGYAPQESSRKEKVEMK